MWQSIDTAPKDGSTVYVRRIYEGRVVYEGPAEWRQHDSEALFDPITGEQFATAETSMRWKYPLGHKDDAYCVPVPTEWKS
jgi:hypothetical protein